nr:hypothetical protein [Paraburkholderia caribensis]
MKVERTFGWLVIIPHHIQRNGVHPHCLRHLDAMPPVFNGNARRMQFTTSDLKWCAVEQEAIAVRSKTEDVRSIRPDRACLLRGRLFFHVTLLRRRKTDLRCIGNRLAKPAMPERMFEQSIRINPSAATATTARLGKRY